MGGGHTASFIVSSFRSNQSPSGVSTKARYTQSNLPKSEAQHHRTFPSPFSFRLFWLEFQKD